MARRLNEGDIIELVASEPDADLACDYTIATEGARAGLVESLLAGMASPARRIEGGVEVAFRAEAADAVMRYVDLESRCCAFLNLAVERTGDALVLRVTGRPEAVPLIEDLFLSRKDAQ